MAVSTKQKKKTGRGAKFIKLIIFLACALCMVMAAKKFIELRSEERIDFSFQSNTIAPQISYAPANFGSTDPAIAEALAVLADEDSRVRDVIANIDEYPEPLLALLAKNPDAREFVLDYPQHRNDKKAGKLNDSEKSGGIPLLLQWDKRWGYTQYGSGPLGITGCGPTCLSMVLAGLSGDGEASPAAVAAFSEKNGYYVEGSGSSWNLMSEGAAALGLTVASVPLWEDSMVAELNAGHPIIANVGAGDFTDSGHFIVIRGYENGMFLVNDPNSPSRSNEGWYYTTLEKQIKSLWSYSLC